MYKLISCFILVYFISLVAIVNSQDPADTEVWEPVPKVVEPGYISIEKPSDAIILFDGRSFDEWEQVRGDEIEWLLEDGVMTMQNKGKSIRTRRTFKDFQFHLEWRVPEEVIGEAQRRGNSGVFLQERYEIQILDNWENPTYANGMAGSVYKQHIPLSNPAKRPGEWQALDIFYTAPVFGEDGDVKAPARVTALLNGVLILNNVEIFGTTRYIGEPEYDAHGPGAILLQDYPHPGKVSFSNIWIRELDQDIVLSDGVRDESQ